MCNIQTRIRAQGDQLRDQVDQLHEQVDQLREQVDKVIDYLIYQRIEQKVEKKKVYEIIRSRSFLEFIPSSVLLKSQINDNTGKVTIYEVKIKSL